MSLRRIPFPEDAELETIFRNQLLISLKSDWVRGDETWPQGALISVDLDDLLNGEGKVSMVVAPDSRSAISEVERTRDLVLGLVQMDAFQMRRAEKRSIKHGSREE